MLTITSAGTTLEGDEPITNGHNGGIQSSRCKNGRLNSSSLLDDDSDEVVIFGCDQ